MDVIRSSPCSRSSYSAHFTNQLNWEYSVNIHRRTTIEQLAENYMQALRAIIIHCQSPEAGGHTPSDFPLANLNNEMEVRTDDNTCTPKSGIPNTVHVLGTKFLIIITEVSKPHRYRFEHT